MDRREFLRVGTGVVSLAVIPTAARAAVMEPALPPMTIYKSETCLCCEKWVDHVKAAGFRTTVHNRDPVEPIKDEMGIPRDVRSCHTARVGSYVVEGHVPAADIKRLLKDKPKTMGLAVPGMPVGTPGMDQPGVPAEPYHVVAFQKSGATSVFAKY